MITSPLTITAPKIKTRREPTDQALHNGLTLRKVTRLTPGSELKALRTLLIYFNREFKYNNSGLPCKETMIGPTCRYFYWLDYDFYSLSAHPQVVIGMAQFDLKEWTNIAGKSWELSFVWLHPYYRNKGLLSASWPLFMAEFGEFLTQGPHSKAMKGFLEKPPKVVRVTTDNLDYTVYTHTINREKTAIEVKNDGL